MWRHILYCNVSSVQAFILNLSERNTIMTFRILKLDSKFINCWSNTFYANIIKIIFCHINTFYLLNVVSNLENDKVWETFDKLRYSLKAITQKCCFILIFESTIFSYRELFDFPFFQYIVNNWSYENTKHIFNDQFKINYFKEWNNSLMFLSL